MRLKPLTRMITGDDRPKQFCSILGRKTLLDQTRRRVSLLIPPERTLVVVTRTHELFYAPLVADMAPRSVVVQPENRGTAPAVLLTLLRVAALAPTGSVALFPSDHYVSDDRSFMTHVEGAFEALLARPDFVTLLGIAPDRPEVEYGWIEPGGPIPGLNQLQRVLRFWEKPAPALAETLFAQGCLWNSFVMVARVPTLLGLIRSALSVLYDAFAAVRPMLGTGAEAEALQALYARLPSTNFSKAVLATQPANLAVLPVSGVGWTDLGDPHQVRVVERKAAHQPDQRAYDHGSPRLKWDLDEEEGGAVSGAAIST